MTKLPKHIALSIEHNEHLTGYQTYADWFDSTHNLLKCFDDDDWVSPEQKTLSQATESVWQARWYPITPVGHCTLLAATLEALLAALAAQE